MQWFAARARSQAAREHPAYDDVHPSSWVNDSLQLESDVADQVCVD